MKTYDIVVVGGGPAGLAAATHAKKNGCHNILVVEREKELGGILQQCIHSGFGLHIFKEELTGPEYAQRFIEELYELDIVYQCNTTVIEITQDKKVKLVSSIHGFEVVQAKAIVLAMGCRERTRDNVLIPGYRPAGILTAGMAQRLVNIEGCGIGNKIVIVGSGDIGLIMARRLSLEGAKVEAVVEIMPYYGGLTRNVVQCLDDFDIPLLLNHRVLEVQGKERVEGVIIAKIDEDKQLMSGSEKILECDTLLLSVGLIPENELSINAGIQLDPMTKGSIVNESMETNVKGIFACGNVLHVHDLVDYVTDEAAVAGQNAARFVLNQGTKGAMIKTCPSEGIRYVIPQKICINSLIEEKIRLLFRVEQPYYNINIDIKLDGRLIKQIKKECLKPSEMESIYLDFSNIPVQLNSNLSVALRKEC